MKTVTEKLLVQTVAKSSVIWNIFTKTNQKCEKIEKKIIRFLKNQ